MTAEIHLLHLYPRELGINGDAGNVTALVARAGWRGLSVVVHEHDVDDELPTGIDLVHIGSGPLSAQRAVHTDVLRIRARLAEWFEAGVPFLAIAAGWQLLGREIVAVDGERLEGAGLFPSGITLSTERAVGEIVVRSQDDIFTGFENHSGTTRLDAGAVPFASVVSGRGNAPDSADRSEEGVRVGESIGTNLHGPILPMNPLLADRLLLAALRRSQPDAVLGGSDDLARVDDYAARSREAVIERLGVHV